MGGAGGMPAEGIGTARQLVVGRELTGRGPYEGELLARASVLGDHLQEWLRLGSEHKVPDGLLKLRRQLG